MTRYCGISDIQTTKNYNRGTAFEPSAEPTTTGLVMVPLRKRAYSNILRILLPKNENFQMKNSCTFHISAQNIDCGYLLELRRF